jgi:hypothetical protein
VFFNLPIPPPQPAPGQLPAPAAAEPPAVPPPPLPELPPASVNVFIATMTVQNIGSREATNLQLVYPARPQLYRLEPPVKFTDSLLPTGEYVVEIPSLAPKEFVSVHTLQFMNPIFVVYVRSDQGRADETPFMLQRVLPRWISLLLLFLVALGIATILYGIYNGILWLSRLLR